MTPENSATPERQDDKFKTQVATIQKANKKKGIKGIKSITIDKINQGFKIRTQLLPYLQCGSTCFLSDFDMSGASGSKYIYYLEHVVNNTGLECYTDIYCV